jgi:nicotinate-nucleotide adenylyltransferase
MPEVAPLGIYGGTFDPVHFAHLRLAEEARQQLGLAEVLWLPAGQPKHRVEPRCAPQHRLAMVRLAIADNPAFRLDDSEALAPTPSYTVPTLERLRTLQGAARPLVLLLGADAFLGLAGWHRWRELFSLAHLAVATRPGSTLDTAAMPAELAAEFSRRWLDSTEADAKQWMQAAAGTIQTFQMAALDISATALRAALASGRSVRYLAPAPVVDYISRNQLYS